MVNNDPDELKQALLFSPEGMSLGEICRGHKPSLPIAREYLKELSAVLLENQCYTVLPEADDASMAEAVLWRKKYEERKL